MNKYMLLLLCINIMSQAIAQESRQLSIGGPNAIADLRTEEGAALVNANWYVQPATLAVKQFRSPGPGSNGDALPLYPTGNAIQTHTLEPQIGSAGFEKGFMKVSPAELEKRQGTGLFSFIWYKIEVTLPSAIGDLAINGTTAVFEIVVDDYSEVWVNGKQQPVFGESGNGLISGYNSRNRVVLTNNAKPGEHFDILVLAINGPIGQLPENYIWVRNAFIDFYKEPPVNNSWKDIGKIEVIDQQLENVISAQSKVEKIADGFQFTEGPVWHPDGYLLFSDPNANVVYRYNPVNHNVGIYISHSGYAGADIGQYKQPGSNGLAIDRQGRLIVAQHGNRRVIRHEKKGPVTVLVDRIDEKRLNSPNDLVLKSDGSLYITDPPYGLPEFYNDKRKELPYQGVILYKDGKARVVAKECGGPNGIAFSPDEKYLYVGNWDIRDIHNTKTVWRYEVQPDGSLKNGKVFFNWNFTEGDEAIDGIKVDKEGNLFVSAPGGVWIISAEAKLLGKIITPERPANMAWGGADGKTLYMTAHSSLYKVSVRTGGKFSWE
ncbi:MAG TPA: SMP-30/gluconolactonase/LRE family protein [Chitinophagaceae bacterium]